MLATLDDPFTRFLEPEKFKSLRVRLHFLLHLNLMHAQLIIMDAKLDQETLFFFFFFLDLSADIYYVC